MSEHPEMPEEDRLAAVAAREVTRLTRAVRLYRLFIIVLGVTCAALVGGGITLGLLWASTSAVVAQQARQAQAQQAQAQVLARQAQAQARQAYQGCLAGNEYRAGDERIWGFFVQLATRGKPNPEASQLLGYVARVDAPRNCGPLKPPAGG